MKKQPVHNATQRVISIFNLLTEEEHIQYSLTEIAEKLQAPKSSLLPILQTLAANRYLMFHERSKTYSVGYKLFETGMYYFRSSSLSKDVQRIMNGVVADCKEACNFAELNDGVAIVLMRVDSPNPIKMYSNMGQRIPLHCSAMGKALLADKSDDEIRALVGTELEAFTPNTITDVEEYIKQVREMKREGIYRDYGEHTYEVRAIGVPICKDGAVIAAMSIPVPAYRFTDSTRLICEKALLAAKSELESMVTSAMVDKLFV